MPRPTVLAPSRRGHRPLGRFGASANTALHYLGEGEATNYAPTARFYTERQTELSRMLTRLVQVAYDRKVALGLARKPATEDYGIAVAVTETARADNAALAEAARDIVQALSQMRAQGWIDDASASPAPSSRLRAWTSSTRPAPAATSSKPYPPSNQEFGSFGELPNSGLKMGEGLSSDPGSRPSSTLQRSCVLT